ncbi:GPI inositol deacylase [Dimargaris verticillata]|uniref:GPI inositol-deacylase n=1 Tax=Dimargaris verticillata TaxID=2761393 RepID=A0A9W8B3J6_9FUNG|nr:GPI inositol deacylase [Dimargaris verticillata]
MSHDLSPISQQTEPLTQPSQSTLAAAPPSPPTATFIDILPVPGTADPNRLASTAMASTLSRRRGYDDHQDATSALPLPPTSKMDQEAPLLLKSTLTLLKSREPWPSQRRRWRTLTALAVFSMVFMAAMLRAFFVGQSEPRGCDMFYMYPKYLRMAGLTTQHSRLARKYALYLYREGGVDHMYREPFRTPVLFIPGHAGSYKQVRSIAATTTRQFDQMQMSFPLQAHEQGNIGFDFFTIDLNEEFTALHGYSLHEQAEFVNDVVRYILSLYPINRPKYRNLLALQPGEPAMWALPQSVLIIGHSMGGVVARTALMLPNYQPRSINTILTLSSPHLSPAATLESYVDQLYRATNEFWIQQFNTPANASLLADVSLVSIAGGNWDAMVGSDLAFVDTSVPASHGFTVFTTQIPHVWLSMDHQSILWCKQMVQVLGETLLSVADARRPEQTKALPERLYAFRRTLVSNLDAIQAEVSWAPDTTASEPASVRSSSSSRPLIPTSWHQFLRTPFRHISRRSRVSLSHWNQPNIRLVNTDLTPTHLTAPNEDMGTVYLLTTRPDGRDQVLTGQWEFMSGRDMRPSLLDVGVCQFATDLGNDLAYSGPIGDRWEQVEPQLQNCYSLAELATILPAFDHPQPLVPLRQSFSFLAIPSTVLAQFDVVAVFCSPPFGPSHPWKHHDFVFGQFVARSLAPTADVAALPSIAQSKPDIANTASSYTDSTSAKAAPVLTDARTAIPISLYRSLLGLLFSPISHYVLLGSTVRTTVQLLVPNNPVFAYWVTLQTHPKTGVPNSSPDAAQTPLLVHQTDFTHSEGRFWFNASRLHVDFHRRGPYIPATQLIPRTLHPTAGASHIPLGSFTGRSEATGHGSTAQPLPSAAPANPHQWPGLTLTMFADPDAFDGVTITVTLDWWGSMGRIFKRYDMLIVSLPMLYVLIAWMYQWNHWNRHGVFPAWDHTLRILACSYFGAVLVGLTGLVVIQAVAVQLITATYGPCWHSSVAVSSATLAYGDLCPAAPSSWQSYMGFAVLSNLFLGHRGEGTWLVTLVLGVCALGLLVVIWSLLAGFLWTLAWIVVAVRYTGLGSRWLGRLASVPVVGWLVLRGSKLLRRVHKGRASLTHDRWLSPSLEVLARYLPTLNEAHDHYALGADRQYTLLPAKVNRLLSRYRRVMTGLVLLVFVATFMPYQFAYCTIWTIHFVACVKTRVALGLAEQLPILAHWVCGRQGKRRNSNESLSHVDVGQSYSGTKCTDGIPAVDSLRSNRPATGKETVSDASDSSGCAEETIPWPQAGVDPGTERSAITALLSRQYQYQLTVLLFLFLLLPFNMPEIVVWMRNISVSWTEDAASDHNIVWIAPFLLLTKYAVVQMPPRFVARLLPSHAATTVYSSTTATMASGDEVLSSSTLASSRTASREVINMGTGPNLPAQSSSTESLPTMAGTTPTSSGSPSLLTVKDDERLTLGRKGLDIDYKPDACIMRPDFAIWAARATNGVFVGYMTLVVLWGVQQVYLLYTWGTLFALWWVGVYAYQAFSDRSGMGMPKGSVIGHRESVKHG